ncbi:MAG: flagellin [Gammaproteobacteria bacterium]|nr:flagellin [Gammaproteobacteria bacterium]
MCMALVINTNIGSIQAERALAGTRETMETSMQRLATGRRINSASDDAAGIAVASRMTDQMRALNMAIRNASDGLSLAQTAEGSIEEMQNILQRMRELGVQAANGTYTDTDRSFLDLEYQALMSELYRISKSTAWDKDLKVLDDDVQAVDIQVGADAGEVLNIPLGPLTPRALGLKTETSDVGKTGTNFDGATAASPQTSSALTAQFPSASAPGTDFVVQVSVTNGRSVTIMAEDVTDIDDLVAKLNADIDSSTNSLTFSKVANTDTLVLTHGSTTFTATITTSVDTSGIDTLAEASKALAVIDDAQDIVNEQRSKLGAAMNRVQYTISNLMNVVENTSEAKSRIYDTDYAAESAALARTQVLAQAGTAMLAQANQSTQYVLNLLRQG